MFAFFQLDVTILQVSTLVSLICRFISHLDVLTSACLKVHILPSGVIKRCKLGNPLEMGVSIGKSAMNCVFSIAMFDHRMVACYE